MRAAGRPGSEALARESAVKRKSLAFAALAVMVVTSIAPSVARADPNCNTGRTDDNLTYVVGKYLNAQAGVRFNTLNGVFEIQRPKELSGNHTYTYMRLQSSTGQGRAVLGINWVPSSTTSSIFWNFYEDDGSIIDSGAVTIGNNDAPYRLQLQVHTSQYVTWNHYYIYIDGVKYDEFKTNEFYDNWVPTKSQVWTSLGSYGNQVPGGTTNWYRITNLYYISNYGTQNWAGVATTRKDLANTEAQLETPSSSEYRIRDMRCSW